MQICSSALQIIAMPFKAIGSAIVSALRGIRNAISPPRPSGCDNVDRQLSGKPAAAIQSVANVGAREPEATANRQAFSALDAPAIEYICRQFERSSGGPIDRAALAARLGRPMPPAKSESLPDHQKKWLDVALEAHGDHYARSANVAGAPAPKEVAREATRRPEVSSSFLTGCDTAAESLLEISEFFQPGKRGSEDPGVDAALGELSKTFGLAGLQMAVASNCKSNAEAMKSVDHVIDTIRRLYTNKNFSSLCDRLSGEYEKRNDADGMHAWDAVNDVLDHLERIREDAV